jgi:hypothetical protein
VSKPLFEQAVRYHAAAVSSVNDRLKDPELQRSDGIVASILCLSVHYPAADGVDSWNVHMEGLKRVLRLRGGEDSLRDCETRKLLFL